MILEIFSIIYKSNDPQIFHLQKKLWLYNLFMRLGACFRTIVVCTLRGSLPLSVTCALARRHGVCYCMCVLVFARVFDIESFTFNYNLLVSKHLLHVLYSLVSRVVVILFLTFKSQILVNFTLIYFCTKVVKATAIVL